MFLSEALSIQQIMALKSGLRKWNLSIIWFTYLMVTWALLWDMELLFQYRIFNFDDFESWKLYVENKLSER